MRILTITANDSGVGGASRVAMDLHRHYLAAGHQSHVLAGKKVSSLDSVTELKRPLWRKAAAFALSNDFEFFDGEQVLRSEHFRTADVVHCHNLNGWYFNLAVLPAMARLKPLIWTLHDMWAMTPHSAYTSSRELENGLFRISDPTLYPVTLWNNDNHLSRRKAEIYAQTAVHLVAPCKWLADLAGQTCLGSKPTSIIFNGIDTSKFVCGEKAAAREELGLGNGGRVVLFLGASASSPFKGYEDFEWMASGARSDIQFVCLGAESDRVVANVKQFAATRDKTRVAAFLSAADVLVMPSRFEVFPLVMIEAMACGTRVVAYDVGGIGEMLTNAPGCAVVTPVDREKLRADVDRTLEVPELAWTKIAAELRRIVEEGFTLDVMGGAYLKLFAQCLARGGGRR